MTADAQPSTVPDYYNNVTMSVDAPIIGSEATAVLAAIDGIVAGLAIINNALTALQLSWAGATATEAQAFIDKWQNEMDQLFGTAANPDGGVLNIVANALNNVNSNYEGTEDAITQMFNQLNSGLKPTSTPADSQPIAAGQTINDGTVSAVSETGWSALQAPGT